MLTKRTRVTRSGCVGLAPKLRTKPRHGLIHDPSIRRREIRRINEVKRLWYCFTSAGACRCSHFHFVTTSFTRLSNRLGQRESVCSVQLFSTRGRYSRLADFALLSLS